MFDVNKVPSPGTQTDSEHEVEDMHQNVLVCEIPLQMSYTDGMPDESVPRHAQHDEIIRQQISNQVTELQIAGSAIYNEDCITTESTLVNSENAVDHGRDDSLAADNASTVIHGDKLGSSSSQLKVLEKTNGICKADASTTLCKADASTTINCSDPMSSDKCSYSETNHLVCSEDQSGVPDAALDVALQKQSSAMSYSLDARKLELNVTKTGSADNDTISSVAVEIQDDTSRDIWENFTQHPR